MLRTSSPHGRRAMISSAVMHPTSSSRIYPETNPLASTDAIIALTHVDIAAPAFGVGTCWAGFVAAASLSYQPLQDMLNLPKRQGAGIRDDVRVPQVQTALHSPAEIPPGDMEVKRGEKRWFTVHSNQWQPEKEMEHRNDAGKSPRRSRIARSARRSSFICMILISRGAPAALHAN